MKPGIFYDLIRAVMSCAALVAFTSTPVFSQALPPDVGLVTKISGEVTYGEVSSGKKPEKAKVLMKVRRGDRFEAPQGASVQIVYFANGRQETWKGPVELRAGEKEGQVEGKAAEQAKPEVRIIPAKASQEVKRIPALLRQVALARAGGIQLRGNSPARLDQEEQAEIEAARKTCDETRKQAAEDDITAELCLLGILMDYNQYSEMAKVLASARGKQPGNEDLKLLEEWVKSRKQ